MYNALNSYAQRCAILKNESSNIDDDDLLELNRDVRGNIPGAHRLDARRRLWRVFTDMPEDEQIHIFVQRPAPSPMSSPLSAQSGRSRKSIHATQDDAGFSGVAKHRRDFDKFHSENGVRTVMGTIGPVSDGRRATWSVLTCPLKFEVIVVRMLLKNGYRHVYISRKFALKHGFIPSDAAPGNYGYSGLVILGKWPMT